MMEEETEAQNTRNEEAANPNDSHSSPQRDNEHREAQRITNAIEINVNEEQQLPPPLANIQQLLQREIQDFMLNMDDDDDDDDNNANDGHNNNDNDNNADVQEIVNGNEDDSSDEQIFGEHPILLNNISFLSSSDDDVDMDINDDSSYSRDSPLPPPLPSNNEELEIDIGDVASLPGAVMQGLRRAIFRLDRHRVRLSIFPTAHPQPASNNDDDGGNDDDNNDDNPSQPSANGDAENQAEPPENAVFFDTNLPAEHSYLGGNLSRVSGVNYLDLDQEHKILLFTHQYILLPGEVLPLMIDGPFIDENITDTQNGMLFGVCFPQIRCEREDLGYGVTCQIYERGTDEQGHTLVKSRALQRFVTKRNEFSSPLPSIALQSPSHCYGYVKILPEIYLPEPLKCLDMGSMKRFRDIESMSSIYKHFQAATTPWQPHVYNLYGVEAIMNQARDQLAQHKILTMPTDPIQLSYWLVRNLHISDVMVKKCFLTDSVNIRMKLIASTFKEAAIFTCRLCSNHVANCPELFAMSKHGVQTQYCNSAGYIHETNTVYQCVRDAISYSGTPSTEFSWFPGYQWQIIICSICSRHLGWEFKALEPNLVPKVFYGLAGSSVRICTASNASTNPRDMIYRIMRRARPTLR